MTDLASLRDLFSRLQPPERTFEWLMNMYMQSAVRVGALTVENWSTVGFPSAGAFRSFLVRFCAVGSREAGRELNPYGDRFQIHRATEDGMIGLDIQFVNTPAEQSVTIKAVPVSTADVQLESGLSVPVSPSLQPVAS
jgi:hypothetical protein